MGHIRRQALILLAGTILMAILNGCSEDFTYEEYRSKNPRIDFVIDRLTGWAAEELVGSFDSFLQIGFYEPIEKGKDLRAMVVINVQEEPKTAFTPKTLEGMRNDLIRKRLLLDSAKVVSEKTGKVLGLDAFDITFSYKLLNNLDTLDAKMLPCRERVLIFTKGTKFYTLRYVNMQEGFGRYARAFDHIARSLRFSGTGPR